MKTQRDDLAEALELSTWLLIALVAAIVAMLSFRWPAGHETPEFPSVDDRPVLESKDTVWKARATGNASFDYDGEHYVIEGLPTEYVDYSSRYVRMP